MNAPINQHASSVLCKQLFQFILNKGVVCLEFAEATSHKVLTEIEFIGIEAAKHQQFEWLNHSSIHISVSYRISN